MGGMSLEPQPCLVGLDCVKVTTTSKQNIELHSYVSGFNVVADQCRFEDLNPFSVNLKPFIMSHRQMAAPP